MPVVADGGDLMLYSPHVKEFNETTATCWPRSLHTRDSLHRPLGRFGGYPVGVLAHSTHLAAAAPGTLHREQPPHQAPSPPHLRGRPAPQHNVYLDPAPSIRPSGRKTPTPWSYRTGEVLHQCARP